MAGIARVTRVTVHAARRLAVTAGVAVPGHRAGSAAATNTHGVQGRRIGRVRAWCQFIMRHPRICAAQTSRRLSTVHLENIIGG